MSRLWDKGDVTHESILHFCVGRDFQLDERLVAFDIKGTKAHAQMLRSIGILTQEECNVLIESLDEIGAEHAKGSWKITVEEEDCHTALENRLVAKLGETGQKIHTGRSRNDQVLAALRLYLLDAVQEIKDAAKTLAGELLHIAEEQGDLALPGYTHMQRAMPSSVRLWAEAFAAEIACDVDGLEASKRRMNKNPLGSAAGYGTSILNIDRAETTAALGFSEIQTPVTAVQLSRGKAEAGLLFEITLLMQDVGRLAAEICLFASQEFGFVKLPHEFTTGSSIMPQKRNPDVFELIRGKSSMAHTRLMSVLAVTSKLTSGYHRDLQLIKEPLFDGIDEALECLAIASVAIGGLEFQPEKTAAKMTDELFATEKAYRLVLEEGLPFRQAYQVIAKECS